MAAVSGWIADLQGKKVQQYLLQKELSNKAINHARISYFDDESTECDEETSKDEISIEDMESQICEPEEIRTNLIEKVSDMVITSTMYQYLDDRMPSILIPDASPKVCPSPDYFSAHQDLMTALKFQVGLRNAMKEAAMDDTNMISHEPDSLSEPLSDVHEDARYHTKKAEELLEEMREMPDLAELMQGFTDTVTELDVPVASYSLLEADISDLLL